ncbi:LPXTG cell wall anchor domain-containing protein [Streptococcus suis]|nr:LPXTG cell wall anchor domain-containing protein [Streptococcus suis]
MFKKSMASILALSTAILLQVMPVFAGETLPLDSSAPIEAMEQGIDTYGPEEPTETSSVPEVTIPAEPIDTSGPVDPSEPVVPTVPEVENTTPTEPVEAPIDPTSPSTDSTIPSSPTPTQGTSENTPGLSEVPSETPPVVPTESPEKTTEEVNQTGESQVGTISTSTGQEVVEVTPEKPITTEAGFVIIGTENSQPIVRYADGSTATVTAEAIGAVVNPDRTISVKTTEGTMTTLPETGEVASLMISLLGITLLGLTSFLKQKQLL